MQSPTWYFRRLKAMSSSEVLWRISSLASDTVDRVRIPFNLYPGAEDLQAGENPADVQTGFSIHRDASGSHYDDAWRERLIGQADAIAAGRLSYFDHENHFLGDPINWHRDHRAKIDSPRGIIYSIDYRDFPVSGDCKQVWEPNRHHQFVVLARAYSVTGEQRYAEALASQMDSWIDANPFGYGMNWRSPLELGIRLINWVWALELIRESNALSGERWRRVFYCVYLHCWETHRKLSQGSSANNHLVGEAAGIYVAARYFPSFPGANNWQKTARQIIEREIHLQSFDDGCTKEQALGYQFFVIQFYLVCGLTGRWSGQDFDSRYWSRLQKMLEFVQKVSAAGPLPLFGDQDDGYVLDLGDNANDCNALAAIGDQLFATPPVRYSATRPSESAYWYFGGQADKQSVALDEPDSEAFKDAGYYLLQARQDDNLASVLFDCAELGYGAIAAHGHADALSFSYRAFGEYLLVDTGTYDYFSEPEWRNYFRSTAAHNTIVIDNQDQSTIAGPFLWGQRANATCLEWTNDPEQTVVEGEHDGYRRLPDPVTHRRRISLDKSTAGCAIRDQLFCEARHDVAVYFHLGPTCKVSDVSGNTCTIQTESGHEFQIAIDAALSVELTTGSDLPISGWYSPGYHQKLPITTIKARCQIDGTTTFEHRIALSRRTGKPRE